MEKLAYYFIAVNAIAFIIFLLDKKNAKKRKWRVPESLLLAVSALGGSAGGYISMQMFRHKTRKPAFRWGLPVLIVIHILLIIYYTKTV